MPKTIQIGKCLLKLQLKMQEMFFGDTVMAPPIIFMASPANVGEVVTFSGCPSAAFVQFVCPDR